MAITFVDAATDGGINDNTCSVAVPAGTQDDDLLIGMASVASGSGWLDWTQPSGWTEIDDFLGGTTAASRFCLAYKIASSESGTWDFVIDSSVDRVQATVGVYRGVDTSDPFDVTWVRANHAKHVNNLPDGSTNTSAAAITTESANAWVLLFNWISHNDMEAVNGYGPPTGYTTRLEHYNESDAYRGHYLCDKAVASASTETPGDFTHTENGAAVNDSSMFTLAIKEAAAAGLGIPLAYHHYQHNLK